MPFHDLAQLGNQVGHGKLGVAQTDAHHQILAKQSLPGFALPGTVLVNPAAQATDQSRFFQQRQKQSWRNVADARVLPTQQRFEPASSPIGNSHLRLIHEIEITVFDGRAYAFFEHQARSCPTVHFVIVKPILLTTGALGLVHGNIGRTHQTVEIGTTIGKGGNTNTGTKDDIHTVDLLADRYPFDEFFRNFCRLFRKFQVQQRRELIAPHACQDIERAQTGLQLF
ncbi:hypothetical protein D3C76_1132380 [compost metagenome]